MYTPDGGKAFARHLEASGEPFIPLTAWTFRDTPGIEELSHQGVWDLTGQREMFRYNYLQRELPDSTIPRIVLSIPTHTVYLI